MYLRYMHLETSSPYEGKVDHIVFKRDPSYYGVGTYKDIEDRLWDVWGIIRDIVLARLVDDSGKYSTSSDCRGYSIRYLPYTYSTEKDKNLHEKLS